MRLYKSLRCTVIFFSLTVANLCTQLEGVERMKMQKKPFIFCMLGCKCLHYSLGTRKIFIYVEFFRHSEADAGMA